MIEAPEGGDDMPAPRFGPLEHETVELEPGRTIACVSNGLVLAARGEARVVPVVSRSEGHMGPAGLRVEVVASDAAEAERFLADLRQTMRELDVYRGRVLAFTRDEYGEPGLRIQQLPSIDREEIVLPPGTLELIERHALAPTRHRERLLAAKRHLKRGLLLHGPPGTGKTLTTMHLVSRMPGRTVVMLTGEGARGDRDGLRARALHRRARGRRPRGRGADLPRRVHPTAVRAPEPDGRPGVRRRRAVRPHHEPPRAARAALAARPGRIDQAVELPLPDADDRRRLAELYARGLTVEPTALDRVVQRTDGASAALVREALRKAAVFAAEARDGPIEVREADLDAALDDLSGEGGALARTMLGRGPSRTSAPFGRGEEDLGGGMGFG